MLSLIMPSSLALHFHFFNAWCVCLEFLRSFLCAIIFSCFFFLIRMTDIRFYFKVSVCQYSAVCMQWYPDALGGVVGFIFFRATMFMSLLLVKDILMVILVCHASISWQQGTFLCLSSTSYHRNRHKVLPMSWRLKNKTKQRDAPHCLRQQRFSLILLHDKTFIPNLIESTSGKQDTQFTLLLKWSIKRCSNSFQYWFWFWNQLGLQTCESQLYFCIIDTFLIEMCMALTEIPQKKQGTP